MYKKNKYNAIKTTIDGIKFDSKKESKRYLELKGLQDLGEIEQLEMQPKFLLQDGFRRNGKAIREINYIADFIYTDVSSGEVVVEDVKGVQTDVFKLKYKLFLFKYPYVILRII